MNHGGTAWENVYIDTSMVSTPCAVPGCYGDYFAAQAAITADADGKLILAYTRNDVNGTAHKMYLRTSSDGVAWSSAALFNDQGDSNFPAIVAGPTAGDFRLAWQDNRHAVCWACGGLGSWNTWYARTTNGGGTWTASVRLSSLGSGAPYKTPQGYAFPDGDYFGLAVDSSGTNRLIGGEADGSSLYCCGGAWYPRGAVGADSTDPSGSPGLNLGQPLADFLDRPRVLEGRRVPDFLTGDKGPNHPAHDLSAPCFRQFFGDVDLVGHGNRANLLAHVVAQLLRERFGTGRSSLQDDICHEGLAFERVRLADDGGLRDFRMTHQGRLDFHRADAMTRDIQHVVDPAHEPEAAVLVDARAVAREILAGDLGPVHLLVPLPVVVQRHEHRGQRLRDHEVASPVHRDGRPFSSTTSAVTPGKGCVAEPGFRVVRPGSGVSRIIPVSVCHHGSTMGQRPPPIVLGYHRHASGLIGSPPVPRRRRADRSGFFG